MPEQNMYASTDAYAGINANNTKGTKMGCDAISFVLGITLRTNQTGACTHFQQCRRHMTHDHLRQKERKIQVGSDAQPRNTRPRSPDRMTRMHVANTSMSAADVGWLMCTYVVAHALCNAVFHRLGIHSQGPSESGKGFRTALIATRVC